MQGTFRNVSGLTDPYQQSAMAGFRSYLLTGNTSGVILNQDTAPAATNFPLASGSQFDAFAAASNAGNSVQAGQIALGASGSGFSSPMDIGGAGSSPTSSSGTVSLPGANTKVLPDCSTMAIPYVGYLAGYCEYNSTATNSTGQTVNPQTGQASCGVTDIGCQINNSSIGQFFKSLTDINTWERVGLVGLAIVLILGVLLIVGFEIKAKVTA